ncbi:MAG: efflux RND transporter periplasmic adaptor subunit [Candidatus Hydrogenedentota bacterium]|uniref:Cobalt/zinc/cadmium efflux RND transporter, membrane fusion protein, CzcB family n=1 Tax=Sumerlaea chitinivorans TaxID=2250252 RepID=A0A2Z4YA78_SUMC1|nr:Cobalt/zinc/cadmium efflux RND transporter, membrane fusion protein, CzcB family [Candidatus Sumerlaea chitinivorans]RMH23974.1 MAG: efflux RND transporter periplasmic adaptor subunit [Candidatus Hydrogenedentota bacterium]GIX43622.1 MAG: hemolysin D [Candidatus Sumerlaea sp.]
MMVVAACWLTGCGGNGARAQLGAEKPEPEPISVATVRVEETSKTASIQVTGNLAADEDSDVASKREGIVQETFVERGTQVEQGAPLVKLDATDELLNLAAGEAALFEIKSRLGLTTETESFDVEEQPEVRSARADYELAQANYARSEKLFREGTINKAEYDQTATQLEATRQRYFQARHVAQQLYASLKTQKVRLRTLQQAVADTTVTAPFRGIVSERYVSPGEFLMRGAKVARLVRIDPIRLVLTIPERYAAEVRAGQKVEFTVNAYPADIFRGEIVHIAPALSTDSRALAVEALVPNPEGKLLPGFFATARLEMSGASRVLLVPLSAVRRDREVGRVFVVRDGVARERVVKLGEQVGDKIEITGDLSSDDVVVVDAAKVSDGIRVR